MTEPGIERAIARVKAGCLEDYGVVVASYHERLRAALLVWCPPGIDVDEIVHLAFVQSYRQLGRYVPGTDFFAWLCTIARHRLMTECEVLRRSARNRDNYLQHVLTHQLQLAVESQSLADEARFQFLDQCLESLRPEARTLIEMRYGQQQAIGGIAAALGRTGTGGAAGDGAGGKRILD